MARSAHIQRKTHETTVDLTLNIDGKGSAHSATGVPFLDHMFDLFAAHSLCDLTCEATGDTHIDDHHSVEDIGICLGQACAKALGTKEGITRYGTAMLPMDEALVETAIDISGRPYLAFDVSWNQERIQTFETALVEEFWHAFVQNAGVTLHIRQVRGTNAHHVCEAIFKSVARAARQAWEIDPRRNGVPSTKGVL